MLYIYMLESFPLTYALNHVLKLKTCPQSNSITNIGLSAPFLEGKIF